MKSSVNVLHPKFQQHLEKVNVSNEKRKLATPDRGVLRTENLFASYLQRTKTLPSKFHTNRKCLFPSKNEDDIVRKENDDLTTQNHQIDSDEVLSKLNVDGLKTCEERSCLKMKVLLVHPNGNVVTRNPTNEKTIQIIRNLLVGGWTVRQGLSTL